MNDYVVDTHALFWYLTDFPKLGKNASLAFDEAKAGNALIHIPAIVLAELYYLNVKLGLPVDFSTHFKELEESEQFVLTSLEPEDILSFDRDSTVSEMHDRMVVGLARRLNAACLTADQNIVASRLVKVIW